MDLREYLRVLRRRWLVIVLCLFLGTTAAALVVLRTTPLYASTVRLFVSTPGKDGDSQAYQGGLFSQQRVTSYADLIKGSTVAERVIDKLHLDESPNAVVDQISAVAAPESVILQVTATDPSPVRAQQLAQATAEVFASYVSELEGATDPATSPIKANIVDSAGLPTQPVSPNVKVAIGLGAVLGLLVGLSVAWLRETLDTTITSPDVLEEITGSALLGAVFYDSAAAKRPLVTQLDLRSPRGESFRVLGTNMQFLNVDEGCKIFAISSAMPGDGKSTTSINIAIALAQAGQRTLLIEADLRRPRVSEYLGLESAVGLTTTLIGQADLRDVVQPWGDSGLDVITSGAIPPNPAKLLQSQAMKSLLAELRLTYDVVIIDTPPALPVTDAALLAAEADGAILVIRHGTTTRDQAAQTKQRLDAVGASIVGTVLNFVPERRGGKGYGYGYGYAPRPGSEIIDPVGPPPASATEMKAMLATPPAGGPPPTERRTVQKRPPNERQPVESRPPHQSPPVASVPSVPAAPR